MSLASLIRRVTPQLARLGLVAALGWGGISGVRAQTPAPSYPAPIYAAPAPRYTYPTPVYTHPAPRYTYPMPVYTHPAPIYAAPAPNYSSAPDLDFYTHMLHGG